MYEEANNLPAPRTLDHLGARLWRYVPLLFWIGVIIFGSGDDVSAANTSRFLAPLVRLFFPGIDDESLNAVHVTLRKLGHFTVYAVLALLAARAFLTSSKNILSHQWLACALTLVALCAFFDEYRQSFLPSRTGTIYDSLLDITGGTFALLVVMWWRSRRRTRTIAAA